MTLAGTPSADRHGRQIRCDHRSCPHHDAIPDRDPRGHHHIGAKPYIIAYSDWRILSRLIPNQFTTGHAMIGRDDRYAGAKQHVASDVIGPAAEAHTEQR